MKTNYTLIGDVREKLKELPDKSIQMCVTSPPYYALRDYGESDQLGLEDTPEEFVENMVGVFAEVHRVLRDDGTLWLNLGDSYLKNKQLAFMPQRVALALQDWGWILRQDIILAKKNCMPESVKDRFTKSHEYIFLFSKQPKYFFNQIREPATQVSIDRSKRKMNFRKITPDKTVYDEAQDPSRVVAADHMRNKRSVWNMRTASYKEAHFAVFPPELAETCIQAGCPEKICAECGTPYALENKYDFVTENKKEKNLNFGKYENAKNESKNRQGINKSRGEKLIKVRTNLPSQNDFVNFMKKTSDIKTLSENTYVKKSTIEHWFRKDKNGFSYPSIEDWNKVKEFLDDFSQEFHNIDKRLSDFELKTDDVISKKIIGQELKKQCDCETDETKPGIVLDCFMGSGTTAMVAQNLFRKWIGVELNPEYEKLIRKRTAQQVIF